MCPEVVQWVGEPTSEWKGIFKNTKGQLTSVQHLTYWAAAAVVLLLCVPNKPTHWEVSRPMMGREADDDDDAAGDDVMASWLQYCSVPPLPACPSSPAWPCPFVFPAQCSICPLGKLPGNTPPLTPQPPTPPTLNTHAFCWLEACALHIKADRLLFVVFVYPYFGCLALFCVFLADGSIIYDLVSRRLSSSSVCPLCSATLSMKNLTYEWHDINSTLIWSIVCLIVYFIVSKRCRKSKPSTNRTKSKVHLIDNI